MPTSYGLANQQFPPQEPYAPFNPFGQYYGGDYQINPKDYLSQFTSAYNQMMNKMQAPQGYNVGTAGIGQWNMPDYLANLNIGQAGMGGYSSDLLNQLGSTYQQMLTNPNESIAMGLARDRITGAGQASQQSLADMIGGMGTRGSGVAAAQQQALNTSLAQQQANAYRDIGLASQQQALTGSQNLEQLRGGLYEQEKMRELQNMDQQLRLQVSKGQLSQEAYENAMQRELANAGLGQTGYENAMSRQLQGAGMQGGFYENAQNRSQQAFEDWQRRQLANAGLGLQAYNQNQGNLQNYYGMFPGMLGQLSNMMQFTGQQDVAGQQQTFQNRQQLSADEFSRMREQYGGEKQYYGDMYNWQNQMTNWNQNPRNVSPWTNYNQTPPKWTG